MIWLLVLSYLFGTFPSAELVAKSQGVDIRQIGSGNPGASNVSRVLGWKWGAVVMALDVAKGAIPTAIGLSVDGRRFAYAMLAAAVLGHMFPVWRRLRGGKGVATAGGGFLVLIPVGSLLLLAVWFAVLRLTGKASVASLVLVVLLPFAVWFGTHHRWELLPTIGIGLLVATRHVDNIRRLIGRREPSLGR